MKQTIIKALLCVVVLLCSLNASAQIKALEKYADMKNVTYVFISKYMLGMAEKNAAFSVPGVNLKVLTDKLSGIQIISSENRSVRTRLRNDVKAFLTKDKYELMMQMNEDDNKVNIYHHIGKQQSAVIMISDNDDEFVIMAFSGKFTMEDVMKMTLDLH
jgi:hypothetical protein